MNLTKLQQTVDYFYENEYDLDYLELGLLFTNSVEDMNELITQYKLLEYRYNELLKKYKYIIENNGEYLF